MKKELILEHGVDVTDILNVTKYDPPLAAELEGLAIGNFPSFIQKTDEERIQNLTSEYESYKKLRFYASEKLDGESSTYFLYDNEFGVCSRNLQMLVDSNNLVGRIALSYNIEAKLRNHGRNLAIQGEIIGEGIKSNKYKLKGQQLRVYNIFDIDKYEYLSKKEMIELCNILSLEIAPTVFLDYILPNTIEELILIADGKSQLNENINREGLVWVSNDSNNRISFKTISNLFLLKYEE